MASTSFRPPFNPNMSNSGTVRPFIRPSTSFYVFQPRPSVPAGYQNAEFDGKRLRKAVARKTVDYNSSIVKMLEARIWQRDHRDARAIQPDLAYYTEIVPPMGIKDNPANCITTKFVRTSTNKMRCPIFCVLWTPEGRRLVTGASSGEFTLWNGLTFNFETILQAHDSAVKAMVWSRSDSWMVTADQTGYVKYWQSNMNNVKMFQAHKEPIRAISFCPTDTKFATCSDDGTIRIWDFMRCLEERILRGHGADVKGVDWHPTKALIASGSKDSQQPVKLWDPKTGQSLATLHAHKNTVTDIKWNQNGNWLLTSSRDHLIKIFDIRNMSCEMQSFRGHKKEVSCLSWHPIHEGLFSSGGSDGSIMFWLVGTEKEIGSMEQAHDSIVWSLSWHPLGHILTSGSNDHSCKFWTRNRPGDRMRDKYNLNLLPKESEEAEFDDDISTFAIPGMGFGDKQNQVEEDAAEASPVIPGFGFDRDEEALTNEQPAIQPTISINRNPNINNHNYNNNHHSSKERKVPFSKPIPKQFQQQWNSDAKLPPTNNNSNNNSNSRRNDSFYSQSQHFDNNNSQQQQQQQQFNNFPPPPPLHQPQNNSNINRFPNPPPNQEFYPNNPTNNNNQQQPPPFQPPPHLGPPPSSSIPHQPPQPYFNGNNQAPPPSQQQFSNQPNVPPHVYSDYGNQNNNNNSMPQQQQQPPPSQQHNYPNNNGPYPNSNPGYYGNQNPPDPFALPPPQQQQQHPLPPFQNQPLPPPLFSNPNSNFNAPPPFPPAQQGPPQQPHQANFGPHGYQNNAQNSDNNNLDRQQSSYDQQQQHQNYPPVKRVRS